MQHALAGDFGAVGRATQLALDTYLQLDRHPEMVAARRAPSWTSFVVVVDALLIEAISHYHHLAL
jgi:hypothetical protein